MIISIIKSIILPTLIYTIPIKKLYSNKITIKKRVIFNQFQSIFSQKHTIFDQFWYIFVLFLTKNNHKIYDIPYKK